MAPHPLFDERVVDLLRSVTDEFVRTLPDSIHAANILLRPGPQGRETETTLDVTFPESGPPADWSLADAVTIAGQELAGAWIASGHKMPAFQFSHRRGEDGTWQASMEPLQEW